MSGPIWTPSPERIARANMTRFLAFVRERRDLDASTYAELHAWSVADPLAFWSAMWDFGGILGTRGARVAVDLDRMPGARFFPDATLNFAENVLRDHDGVSP